ncbi:MAG: gliding motility protein GldN [Bacteroidales bacterium]|nr:gliding motility protein GldN [Bacteroidales bacterium]
MKRLLIIAFIFTMTLGFAVKTYSQQILDTPPRNGVYDKKSTVERNPLPYPYIREADVMWTKRIWRVIDLREKMNQPFYYPETPQNDWRSLVTIIMDALKEGSITAYDASTPTDEFLVPLTYQEIMSRLERIDTVQYTRPYPPYDLYDTIIKKSFYPSDVKRIRIKEDWIFDKQRSQLDVRIIGICPVRDSYTEKGEFRGYDPLFWIYYPEARPIFAKCDVFNRFNSAERKSYDVVFQKRIFSSYIYKEDNVYDRKITEYSTGIDALLESERIKNKIFDFEENLWSY